jgi:hypothetical protein
MNKVFMVMIAGMILFSCDNGTLPDEEKAVNRLSGHGKSLTLSQMKFIRSRLPRLNMPIDISVLVLISPIRVRMIIWMKTQF